MSFFRYPGGKAKFAKDILPLIPFHEINTFCEPFFGGGAITIAAFKNGLMNNISNLLINDIDRALMCLWSCVYDQTEKLIYEIENYTPTVEDFYQFKEDLENIPAYFKDDKVDEWKGYYGFRKLAIHQMSFSGLGTKAGGPIGGVTQTSNYKVDCRWSPVSMTKKIRRIRTFLDSIDNVVMSSQNVFETLRWLNLGFIRWTNPFKQSFAYLDPPYYVKGDDLYQHSFTHDDHVRLADELKHAEYKWLLSYDDCPEVRELYSWAKIIELKGNYTIRTARTKSELVLMNYDLEPINE